MTIHIDDLRFDCIIGLLDFERITAQALVITCKIDYTYRENDFINYADVTQSIISQMQEKKFDLLENALEHLSIYLKEHYPNIESLYLKISKPDILDNATVGLSSFYNYA
jgi:7,8-dihydroneopterin aldolase/epimerase/oxygenase